MDKQGSATGKVITIQSKPTNNLKLATSFLSLALAATTNAAVITSISVSAETQEGGTLLGGGLSVSVPPYPLPTSTGVGLLINPSMPGFSVHSHLYTSSNTPTNATVTFVFSDPAVVDTLNIVQHANGITRVEGFVGDSLASLTSIGNIFGPLGDVTGGGSFPERSNYLFDFNNTTAGRYYQFVFTKTTLSDGYAAYNVIPMDSSGSPFAPASEPASVPEPSRTLVAAGSIFGICFRRIRKNRPSV